MNYIRRFAAVFLSILLITTCAFADMGTGLSMLMPESELPDTATQYYDTGFSDQAQKKVIACSIVVNSVTYGCEFEFEYEGISMNDWSDIQEWLGSVITRATGAAGNNAQALVANMDAQIKEAISTASGTSNPPVWAGSQLKIKRISVSSPYYPQLSQGMQGADVQKLQENLIIMGFMNGTSDGYYGEETVAGVRNLQNYIRILENEKIEEYLATTPEPTAVPTATPKPTQEPTPVPTLTPVPTHELTLVAREQVYLPTATPQVTEEPTSEPTATAMPVAEDQVRLQPQTEVTGIADAALQAYLYSWNFPIVHKEQGTGASGGDTMRIQYRLNNLGYTASTPDGEYGSATTLAIRIFQRTNKLSETGVCDSETQKVLFSVNAVKPNYSALAEGATGEEVRKMQEQLRIYGFTTYAADGSYGADTRAGVETLQQYLGNMTSTKVAVNGIADAVILEELYNDPSLAAPAAMKSGSKGENVSRLQRRLINLGYLRGKSDGEYGNATAEAVSWFQRQHKLTESGAADDSTIALLFSSRAGKAMNPYEIRVSIDDQRVYVYGLDDNNQYSNLVRVMVCSTGKAGSETPKGTYQETTGPGARWHYFTKFDCWAQYAYYIQGDIMFHSVLYGSKEGKVTQSSVNNLGRKASHGCVRLAVEDAEWIYRNCKSRTKVIVY